MDLAFALVIAVAFVLVTGLMIGGLFYVAVVGGRRAQRRRAEAARALGLTVTGSRGLTGLRDDVPVAIRYVTEGSGDNRRSYTYVEATIDPPLRLGLNLRAQGWLGARFAELLSPDLKLGDATFDEAFSLSAVESEEVPRFLAFPEFRHTLMQARASNRRFWMTDDVAHVSMSGHSYDAQRLELALAWVVTLAKNAREARRQMGPTARERAIIATWGGLAGAAGWAFDQDRLSLSGAHGRQRFTIVPLLSQKGWSTRFRIDFSRPLDVSLKLSREGALTGVARFFGMQDIVVGDARFDSTFVVKGEDEVAVRHLFADTAIRDGLVALMGAAKSLDVHDDHIDAVAQGLVDDVSRLRTSIGMVADLAERLVSRVSAPTRGAYR